MVIRYKQSLDYGLLALLGLAPAISLAAHFLLKLLQTWQGWLVAFLGLGGLGIGLAYLSLTYLIRPTMMHQPAKTRLILVALSLALSTLFIAFDRPGSQPLSWIEAAGAQPGQSTALFDQTAWGEHHTGLEIHATTNDDPQWLSQIETGLPPLIRQFGGGLQVALTQPEWAVLDEQGQVRQGGDGVEVRFVVERQDRREIVQQAILNLQARPEQRGWQRVEVSLPAGNQRLRIEAWPGPPGSNNWYDRVWVSVKGNEAWIDNIIKFADWLSMGLPLYFSGLAILMLSQAPEQVKKALLIFVVNVEPKIAPILYRVWGKATSHLPSTKSRFVLILITYIAIWSVANWPALKQAWWYQDDFSFSENGPISTIYHGLDIGRPIASLWFLTYLIDIAEKESYPGNILLRFVQGIIHCLAAFVAALLIWKQTKRWAAFLAVLPFLLWPFNGEAVLWRAAGFYPIAALLSLSGIYAIRYNYPAIGVLALILAMLTTQSAALAGLVVWIITWSLIFLQRKSWPGRQLRFETTYVLAGYIVGGLLSYIIAQHFELVQAHRTVFTSDLGDKLAFLFELNHLFIASDHYPAWLTTLHTILLSGAVILIATRGHQMGWSIHQISLPILGLAATFVTPFLTLLMVAESWPSWRVMYLAPFLITGAWILWDQVVGAWRVGAVVVVGLLCLILIGYVNIARVSASEYVEVFQADLGVLHQMERYVSQQRVMDNQVYVATSPGFVRRWNLHGIKYMHGDSKLSAYLKSWTAHPFVRRFSRLQPTEVITVKNACLAQCLLTKDREPFQSFKLQNSGTLCFCP